jgi:hypothetical protein
MWLIACTGDGSQPSHPPNTAAESLPEQFDTHLSEPFCGMTMAGLELPNFESIEYNEEQDPPDDDGSVVTYTCLLRPSEEEQFAAASRGDSYAIIHTVLSVSHDELTADPSLPSIPVPFIAAEIDWESFGETPNTYVRTVHCTESDECEEDASVEVSSYERTFKALHQNTYIEMSVIFETPLETVENSTGPDEYALGSYESFATHLIMNLTQQ